MKRKNQIGPTDQARSAIDDGGLARDKSLRDELAMTYMKGKAGTHNRWTQGTDNLTIDCYAIADAMIAESRRLRG